MNLHQVVSGAIGAVNPFVPVTVKMSTGHSATADDGTQTPTYSTLTGQPAQAQPLAYKEITHLDSLNVQGTRKAFYMRGAVSGLIRAREKGGDLIVMADGTAWLVVLVSEQWPDWCRVVCTLQTDGG